MALTALATSRAVPLLLLAIWCGQANGQFSNTALAACDSALDLSEQLRLAGNDGVVVLPRVDDWTDKFITVHSTREILFCDGSSRNLLPGFWEYDSAVARTWANVYNGTQSGGCCIYDFPNNEYVYCNPNATYVAACTGALPNAMFFHTMGFPGQDCYSWSMLTEILAEEVTAAAIAADCARMAGIEAGSRRASTRRARTAVNRTRASDFPARFHSMSDVVYPRVNDWTDKFVTRLGSRRVLYCGRVNTANLVGL